MSLFNAVVYCEADKIKVKIEQITPVNPEAEARKATAVSVKSFASMNWQKEYPVFLDDEIVSTKVERILFKAKDSYGLDENEPEKEFYRDAVIYEFPTDPTYFINFARVLDIFSQHASSSAALHHNRSIDEWIEDGKLSRGLYVFFDEIGCIDPPAKTYFRHDHHFIHNTLSLTNPPQSYQKPLQLLKSIMKYAFYEYLHAEDRRENYLVNDKLLHFIMSGRDPYILLDPEVSKATKRILIADLYTTFTQTDNLEELSKLFEAINSKAIKALYKLCIDKQAADGGKYTIRYTEWQFLRHAEFTIRADGRMSIIGLCNNEAYKKYYAEGHRLHDKFEEEIRHLGKVLGLEFADGCDFHRELIFTEQSTQGLKASGLHYNPIYLEKLSAKEAINQSRNMFFHPNVADLDEPQYSSKNICTIL